MLRRIISVTPGRPGVRTAGGARDGKQFYSRNTGFSLWTLKSRKEDRT